MTVYADQSKTVAQGRFDQGQVFAVRRYGGIKPLRRRRKARDIYAFARKCAAPVRLMADSWKSLEHLDCRPFSTVLCLAHGTEVPLQPTPSKLARLRRAYGKATYVIANSEYTAGLVKSCLTRPEKIRVVHPGIETPETDQRLEHEVKQRLEQHGPVLITVARLEQRKGQHHVIRALPALLKEFPALLYVIIGEGSERAALEREAASLGVDQHVLFKGRLEGQQKNAWLANSDLFVMPGSIVGRDVEGFGMAYIEAAWFGLPSIACNAGGAPEAVIHDQTGLVCGPGDQNQLQLCLLRLLRDQHLRKTLGDNARRRAKDFAWASKISEYTGLFMSVS